MPARVVTVVPASLQVPRGDKNLIIIQSFFTQSEYKIEQSCVGFADRPVSQISKQCEIEK